jgi:small subunit ribosomal protein S6
MGRGLQSKGGLFVKRPYETCIVFDGSLPEETISKEQAKLQALIKDNGDFETIDVWGRRELAFPIGKKKVGFYCLFLYSGEGDLNGKIEKALKMNETVLRYLVVVRDPTKPGTSAVAAAMAGKEAAATAAPRSEEGAGA